MNCKPNNEKLINCKPSNEKLLTTVKWNYFKYNPKEDIKLNWKYY